MNEVEQMIYDRCQEIIEHQKKQMDCKHLWHEYGHGYKCGSCDYYTGTNTALNDMIKKQLLQEKMTLKNAIVILRNSETPLKEVALKALGCLLEDAERKVSIEV